MANGKPSDEIRDLYSANKGRLPSFTSIGRYTLVYYTASGVLLCGQCATSEVQGFYSDNGENPFCDDPVQYFGLYDEGPALGCEDCGEAIESSYGDPDEIEASETGA